MFSVKLSVLRFFYAKKEVKMEFYMKLPRNKKEFILCTVFLMSIFLTVIGTWIGSRHISLEPIINFLYKWPRNFAVSLGVEMVIAQPIARFVLLKLHQHKDKKIINNIIKAEKETASLRSLLMYKL